MIKIKKILIALGAITTIATPITTTISCSKEKTTEEKNASTFIKLAKDDGYSISLSPSSSLKDISYFNYNVTFKKYTNAIASLILVNATTPKERLSTLINLDSQSLQDGHYQKLDDSAITNLKQFGISLNDLDKTVSYITLLKSNTIEINIVAKNINNEFFVARVQTNDQTRIA